MTKIGDGVSGHTCKWLEQQVPIRLSRMIVKVLGKGYIHIAMGMFMRVSSIKESAQVVECTTSTKVEGMRVIG